jgi:hypothetical protein
LVEFGDHRLASEIKPPTPATPASALEQDEVVKRRGRSAFGAVVLVALWVGCGGGSDGTTGPASKAQWTSRHGAAIAAVDTELDLARTALSAGDRQSILGACTLLSDDVGEARKGLPVPDTRTDSELRHGLDSVGVGAADCVQGARVASVASLNEKAMAELGDARAAMDAAKQALAAWH